MVNQWLKKAVLLSFRLIDHALIEGGPGGTLVGQGAVQVRQAGARADFKEAGFRAVPGCDRAPLGLYRAGRRADALLRQSRRLRR